MSEPKGLRAALSGKRRMRGFPRWIWWLIFGFPALFLVSGIGFVVEAVIFQSQAESARGEVIDVDASYDSDGGVSYTPLIRYRRRDGRSYEAETHISSSGYDYRIGERVDILYGSDHPGTVRIDSFFSLYGLGLIFAVIGGIFIAVLRLVRKRMFDRGDSVLEQSEAAAAEKWRREARPTTGPQPASRPETTDLSQYGHVHKPKPKSRPTVRRMR